MVKQEENQRKNKSYKAIRIIWATFAIVHGVRKAQKMLGATKGQIDYWYQKVF